MKFLNNHIAKWKPKSWVVLECISDDDGFVSFHISMFKLIKKNVEHTSYSVADSFDELKSILGNAPVVLWATGAGVYHQQKHSSFSSREDLWVKESESEGYLAFMKMDLKEILFKHLPQNINVVGEVIGASGLSGFTEDLIQIGDYSMELEIPKYSKSDNRKIEWNNLKLDSHLLGAYLVSISWYTNDYAGNQDGLVAHNLDNLQRLVMKIGFPFLLILLVINYFVFQEQYSLKQEFVAITSNSRFNNWQIEKKKWEEKKKILELNLDQNVGKKSWYFDQIATSRPSSISLQSLEVFAPIKKNRIEDIPTWSSIISVSGVSKANIDIDNWINQLDELDFIKKVTVLKLKKMNKEFEFIIEIKV